MPRRFVALLGTLVFLAAACRTQSPPEKTSGGEPFPVTLTDDEDVKTTLQAEPRRIVTFAPSHTETLFALGLGERVVGVSGSFDNFPPEAAAIESVSGEGGTEPNVEKVVSLEPDLVLTAFIGGEWKARLRELDIPVFTTLASSLDDTVEDIRTVGALTGAVDRAEELAAGIESDSEDVSKAIPEEERVSCFLELSDLYTVGPGSIEYDLLVRAGCDPVTGVTDEPYPQWSVEQLVQDDPDVFMASEYGQDIEQVAGRPGIRDLSAVKEGRIHLVDGDVISRPGPRIVEGLRALAEALGTA